MQIRRNLEDMGLNENSVEYYLTLYHKYRSGPGKITDWESVRTPDEDSLLQYDSLPMPQGDCVKSHLSRLAVCKLNGGLGTGMGCRGPKSAIPVRDGRSFLDLIVGHLQQIQKEFRVDVPLLLMNSFYTHDETQEIIKKYRTQYDIRCFSQNRFPRIREDNAAPLNREMGNEAWYPPGHGDFYACVEDQGILDRLIDEGKEFLFISNADNLGAGIDLRILNHIAEKGVPFLMEMTPKTAADVKGGTLYQQDGKLKLLEIARVPDQHIDEFCSQRRFKVFNTNNIWINLVRLKQKLRQGRLDLEVIVNRKQVRGIPVVQLETAVGSALECFPGSVGLTVSRDRFLPVKKIDDLLLIQSDLFVDKNGMLGRNPARTLPGLPSIRMGETFSSMHDYTERVPVIPRMLELQSLEIQGDVRFEGEVTLKGEVRLIALHQPLVIPKGAVLENHIVEQ